MQREYFDVDIALMRGTVRLVAGKCTRRQLRAAMVFQGYGEPTVSRYLDMVTKAMRQVRRDK